MIHKCAIQFMVLLLLAIFVKLEANRSTIGVGQEEVQNILIDGEQLESMAEVLKVILLDNVKECDELYEFLKNSDSSLDWIGDKLAWTLLKLAIALDQTFGRDILTLLLNQDQVELMDK